MAEKREILLPDIGDFADVDVAEVLVSKGQRVAAEQSIVVLESDKASMEIPSPVAGTVLEMKVSVGDRVSEGSLIAIVEVDESAAASERPQTAASAPKETAPRAREPAPPEPAASEAEPSGPEAAPAAAPTRAAPQEALPEPAQPPVGAVREPPLQREPEHRGLLPHASPSVRRLARELGIDLQRVPGSGAKGRIRKEDVQRFVQSTVEHATGAGAAVGGVPIAPQVDFSKFGPIEVQPLHRIRKLSAANVHRSWLTVPHVTQFDEADITELEAFRKQMKPEAEARGTKLTFLPFVLKASVHLLKEHPQFNASLDASGENLIAKRYYHVGVAVDTPNGLIVPVLRDADRKGLYEIAAELMELSEKARSRKLHPEDLQGASFTISSLGGIGGSFFTPIVNHPEVAILGVGKMGWKPVAESRGESGEPAGFVPRLLLPLSLSYDHRVIDGADAARFTTRLCELLSDLRRLIL